MPTPNIIHRTAPNPGFCYQSGLAIYDEALINGRWAGRYWAASGFIAPEWDLAWIPETLIKPARTLGLDLHAFYFEINGQALHYGWQVGELRVESLPSGAQHAVANLTSTLQPVRVAIHTEADGTGFFTRWLEITNTSEAAVALGNVAPFCGVLTNFSTGVTGGGYTAVMRSPGAEGTPAYSLGYFAESEPLTEGAFTWLSLPNTPVRIESRNGKSGWGNPFFILRNDLTGEHYIGGWEWSGSWAFEFSAFEKHLERDFFGCGFKALMPGGSPLRVIAPGETVSTPKLHLGLLFAGLDGCVQAWHRHLRQSVLPRPAPENELLVCWDHWSYTQHELSEAILKHEVDQAAEVGAEMFIVDAGWYGDVDSNWWLRAGDWRAGTRLPNGLEPVFAYARSKGLKVGMWFDAERAGSESQVAKQYPDWFLKYYNQPSDELDLTNPAVQRWLESTLFGVIERYKLDLFRLDYNTSPYEGGQTRQGNWMENTRWRTYEFIYHLYERMAQRFPGIIMENCSSGGGRTDLGMMRRFHYTQVTDFPILPRAARILNGMSIALPPDRLLFWTGVGQTTHVRGNLDSQMRLALLSHFGISGVHPAASERNEDQVARIRHHIELFKNFARPLLVDCDVFHHTPVITGEEPGGWCVLEYAAPSRERVLAGLFRLAGAGEESFHFLPRGLDVGRNYRVTADNTGASFVESGRALMAQGITVAIPHALGSELLLFEAVLGQNPPESGLKRIVRI